MSKTGEVETLGYIAARYEVDAARETDTHERGQLTARADHIRYLQLRALERTAEVKAVVASSALVQPGIAEAGYNGDGRWRRPKQEPSWKRMASIYAVCLILVCGTAWVITHWSPSIEVLCAVLVFVLVACFIVHRNTGGCA